MPDWNQLTLHQVRDALAKGVCTSRELVEHMIRTIRERDARLEAYVTLDAEGALQLAEAADERRRRGESAKLMGVPIAISGTPLLTKTPRL